MAPISSHSLFLIRNFVSAYTHNLKALVIYMYWRDCGTCLEPSLAHLNTKPALTVHALLDSIMVFHELLIYFQSFGFCVIRNNGMFQRSRMCELAWRILDNHETTRTDTNQEKAKLWLQSSVLVCRSYVHVIQFLSYAWRKGKKEEEQNQNFMLDFSTVRRINANVGV